MFALYFLLAPLYKHIRRAYVSDSNDRQYSTSLPERGLRPQVNQQMQVHTMGMWVRMRKYKACPVTAHARHV